MNKDVIQVPRYDESGNVIDYIARSNVDIQRDILHTVLILGQLSNGEYMISRLPEGETFWQSGLLATSIATIVRQGESDAEAIQRALKKELHVEGIPYRILASDVWFEHDGYRRWFTFAIVENIQFYQFEPDKIGHFSFFDKDALHKLYMSSLDDFSPSLRCFWKLCHEKL
jgi:hypothetical protein